MKQSPFFRLLAIGAMTAMPVLAFGQDVNPAEADLSEPPAIYSPYVERTANDNTFAEGLYWGDTHLHTNFSTDSGMIGNKLGPEEAYRTDPDFDSAHRAVYYARVLEIPTPTWQAYDAKFYGITMPDNVVLEHQERAYTSPIWYTPDQ